MLLNIIFLIFDTKPQLVYLHINRDAANKNASFEFLYFQYHNNCTNYSFVRRKMLDDKLNSF